MDKSTLDELLLHAIRESEGQVVDQLIYTFGIRHGVSRARAWLALTILLANNLVYLERGASEFLDLPRVWWMPS